MEGVPRRDELARLGAELEGTVLRHDPSGRCCPRCTLLLQMARAGYHDAVRAYERWEAGRGAAVAVWRGLARVRDATDLLDELGVLGE